MQRKLVLSQAVIVEGQYDKIKLESVIDALILPTRGFRIFSDHELRALIRRLARMRGLIVLTDSDAAGFQIRHFLRGMIPPEQMIDVYIPDLYGKERRKRAPSKEGKLGVEGMAPEILLEAFRRAGVTAREQAEKNEPITKLDLYEDGLTGGDRSREKRLALYQKLGFPARLSTNAALPILNAMFTRGEYREIVDGLVGRGE